MRQIHINMICIIYIFHPPSSMCILSIAIKNHPDLPFLLLSNRDESLSRETSGLKLQHFDEFPILAAFDMKEGGTWAGLNIKSLQLSILTNFKIYHPELESLRSRGHALLASLKNDPHYFQHGSEYSPFSLISGDLRNFEFTHFCNQTSQVHSQSLEPIQHHQVHVLSNSHIDDLSWKKCKDLKKQVENFFESFKLENISSPDDLADSLLTILLNGSEYYTNTNDYPKSGSAQVQVHSAKTNKIIDSMTLEDSYRSFIFTHNKVKNKSVYLTRGHSIIFVLNDTLYYYYTPSSFCKSFSNEFKSEFSVKNSTWQRFSTPLKLTETLTNTVSTESSSSTSI